MKTEENQRFTTFDFFTLVFSLAVIVAISAPIINKSFQPDNAVERAKLGVAEMSRVILRPHTSTLVAQNNKPQNTEVESRTLASIDQNSATPAVDMESIQSQLKKGAWEGDVGKDPWGHPYHFSFIRNSTGAHTHIAVWSDGPNQINDSNIHSQTEPVEHPEKLSFKGDDVGAVSPIR